MRSGCRLFNVFAGAAPRRHRFRKGPRLGRMYAGRGSTNRTGDVPSSEARGYDCGGGPLAFTIRPGSPAPTRLWQRLAWGATARPPCFFMDFPPAALLCVRKLLGPADLITAPAIAPAAWRYSQRSVAQKTSLQM